MCIYAKCIDTTDCFKDFLTVGKCYLVKPINNLYVEVVCDDGECHWVIANLFKEERV